MKPVRVLADICSLQIRKDTSQQRYAALSTKHKDYKTMSYVDYDPCTEIWIKGEPGAVYIRGFIPKDFSPKFV